MSGPLTRADTGFSQQGSLDWVALSTNFLSISYGVLQRLSSSNLDPYTVSIGYVLGGQFRLPVSGQNIVKRALDDMKAYAGLQDVLWFGFGMKHPARTIAMTEQGSTLVALCAALAECFPLETAAEILSDMVVQESNLDMTPAVSEWLSLIKSCAGILSTTVFPIRAETLMRLGRDSNFADTKDVAKALNAIAKVTKNEWVSITIHGGTEARWIGALAEWLFGLTVTIMNDDEVLYTNCPDGQISQVNIRSKSRPGRITESHSLEIIDKTFYIDRAANFWGGHESELTHDGHNGRVMETPSMNGRVPWENCLSTVFGVLFKDLIKRPDRVGDVVSSAARIFAAIALAEEGVPLVILETNIHYMEASFGPGFIHTLLQYFPELSVTEKYLVPDPEIQTYKAALRKYRISLKAIGDDCGCWSCTSKFKDRRGSKSNSNCQVFLMELIIRLGRILSLTESTQGLLPKFTGLRKLYNMRSEELKKSDGAYYEDPPGVHRYRKSDLKPPKTAQPVAMDNFPALMEHTLCLFTGQTPDFKSSFPSSPAISVDGVCIYLHILCEIPDSPPKFAMLHVCPGQILYDGKKFSQLTDNLANSKHGDGKGWDKPEIMLGCAFQGFLSSVKLAVKQTVDRLIIHYDIFRSDGKISGLHISPYTVSERMLYNYRRVSCSHSRDSEAHWGDEQGWDGGCPDLWTKFDSENHYKIWSMESSHLGRCAIVGIYDQIFSNSIIALRDTECLSCCRRIREETREHFRSDDLLIVTKPDPNRPQWEDSTYGQELSHKE